MIRDYVTSDFDDLLEISKHIWDGEDYLPHRIDTYLKDPHSFPMVCEVDGRVLSIANLHFLSPSVAWLEAIRTHPDARGKGYATRLAEAMTSKAIGLGAKEMWLLVNTVNVASVKVAEKIGFKKCDEVKMFPNWDILSEALNRLNIESKHLSKHAKKAQEKEDGTLNPYLTLIESLSLSEQAKSISAKWRLCKKLEEFNTLYNKLNEISSTKYVLGEFIAYPPDSHILKELILSESVYLLDEPLSILIKQTSGEIKQGVSYALTTYSPLVVEATLALIKDKWPESIYWLFYPASVDHEKIKPGFHLQGIFIKKATGEEKEI